MISVNATEVRRNWSENLDIVSRKKPIFVKRTHDNFMISNIKLLKDLLSAYKFNASMLKEDDGSYTISLCDLDIAENGVTKTEAIENVQNAVIEYAMDFYKEFDLWSSAPNRKSHIPYVFKALLCDSPKELELNFIA